MKENVKERETVKETRQDNDFKYILQDTGRLYLGARFSYEELLLAEEAPFKLKTIIERYLLEDVDRTTTLESHFYYMTPDSFSGRTYRELKVKIRVSLPAKKKSITGETTVIYRDRLYSFQEFTGFNLAQKKKLGLIVREIAFPKLSLMTFTV